MRAHVLIVHGETLGYSTLTFTANVYNGGDVVQSTNTTIGSAVIACIRKTGIANSIFEIAIVTLVSI